LVHTIPNRNAYSDRDAIWIHSDEFRSSVHRNIAEFAADGWNWRKVTEEQDFIQAQNELIHPAHFARQNCNLQRQFLKIMSAQKIHK
jgi:Zn-finger protein